MHKIILFRGGMCGDLILCMINKQYMRSIYPFKQVRERTKMKKFYNYSDKEKYDYELFHPEIDDELTIHVRKPNRNRSYLNQATEHVKNLNRTVDFVKKRNEDSYRKHKKRLVTFPWKKIA